MNVHDEQRTQAAVLDFFALWHADLAAGRQRTRPEYLACFPGLEPEIAAELDRLATPKDAAHGPAPASGTPLEHAALLEHLRRKLAAPQRYLRQEEIGKGATSRVYRALDLELGREVAVKLHLAPREGVVRRFVREARVIGRLDHPGIVPVHDLGIDPDGHVWFVMRLIRGASLKDLLAEHERNGGPGLRSRFLEALIRICDALSYAHSRGVVHRDVKPSNVMLGDFGEVYVVDWGLARLSPTEVAEDAPQDLAPLETLTGQVLGTPAYMAPEQARGESAAVGPLSDVYALGAILHQFLSGRPPHCDGETRPSSSDILERLAQGRVPTLAREVVEREPELASISRRAMALLPSERYRGASELAADLRAHLEGRTVGAHRGGSLYKFTKWIRRNRILTAGVVLSLCLGGLYARSSLQARARSNELDFLADLRGPLDLMEELETLFPIEPGRKAALADWIRRAEELRARAPEYRRQLDELLRSHPPLPVAAFAQERHAKQRDEKIAMARTALSETRGELEARERGTIQDGLTVEQLRARVASLERTLTMYESRPASPISTSFAEAQVQLLYDRLDQFLAELDAVIGLEGDRDRSLLARAALALADSVPGPSQFSWEAARAAVRSSPRYAGLELEPQRGLVPLGPDPESGLWEFAHVQSGQIPRRNEEGRLELDGESGIVLVLIPGGDVRVGAQAEDPGQPLFDPKATSEDGPLLELQIDPFFLAKHELTMGQWCRLSGRPPELYATASDGYYDDARLPAFGPTGQWSRVVLAAYGLELPASVAWEHAIRGGTTTPWWTGAEPASLENCENLADRTWSMATSTRPTNISGVLDHEDGYAGAAPVGSFKANPFGLHDMGGNLAEWCRDLTIPRMKEFLPGTGELYSQPSPLQVLRGGQADCGATAARSAARRYYPPTTCSYWIGVRASRSLRAP